MLNVQPEGKKTLNHLDSTHRDMYKALSHPSLAYLTIIISSCKQKLKQEPPVTWSIKKWTDDVDAKLQGCFASTDWSMFRDSSDASMMSPQ
jgi:hypothetical protein